MSSPDRIANLLVSTGCYVHKSQTGKLIKVPTGEEVLAYLSCRKLISMVDEREEVEESLIQSVRDSFDVEKLSVAGIATAGIPWGYAIAANTRRPFAYVRSNVKGYGIGGLVEGNIPDLTDEAILVDDVVYSGESVIASQKALESQNIKTVGVVCIATLGTTMVSTLSNQGVKLVSLTNYNNLLDAASEKQVLNHQEVRVMRKIYEGK